MLRATPAVLAPSGGFTAGPTRARVAVRGKSSVARGFIPSAAVSSKVFVSSKTFKTNGVGASHASSRRASSIVTHAASPAMPAPSPEPAQEEEDPYANSPRLYPNLDLDFTPKLTIPGLVSCVVVSWAAVVAYAVLYSKFHLTHYAMTFKVLILEMVSFAIVGAAVFWVVRNVLEEVQEQGRLLSAEAAGDADSLFVNVDGLNVHYKKRTAKGNDKGKDSGDKGKNNGNNTDIKIAISCVHGFGANAYSWERSALAPLAETLNAIAVAHDSPGFGLTERASDLSLYTPRTNAAIARAMLDVACADGNEVASYDDKDVPTNKTWNEAVGEMETTEGGDASLTNQSERKTRRIVIGHSMGGLAAAIAAAEGDVDDVILVAPAVIASGDVSRDASDASKKSVNPLSLIFGAVARIFRVALAFLVSPLLKFALRKLVRSVSFWRNGLARAVGASSREKMRTDTSWADGYRRPSAVLGWDTGIVRVVLAAATGGVGGVAAFFGKKSPHAETDLPANIIKALNASKARVLIVHGSEDFIVPVSNSENLAKMIPKAQLVVMPGVGHLPHEEDPRAFLEAVTKFVLQ
jgi:pimeloyl-ACP methyl ester carboxylesterase